MYKAIDYKQSKLVKQQASSILDRSQKVVSFVFLNKTLIADVNISCVNNKLYRMENIVDDIFDTLIKKLIHDTDYFTGYSKFFTFYGSSPFRI